MTTRRLLLATLGGLIVAGAAGCATAPERSDDPAPATIAEPATPAAREPARPPLPAGLPVRPTGWQGVRDLDAYERDVARFASRYAGRRSGPDFVRGIEELASWHGLGRWERLEGTYRGIGTGLRAANLPPQHFERVRESISSAHPRAADLVAEGYAGE